MDDKMGYENTVIYSYQKTRFSRMKSGTNKDITDDKAPPMKNLSSPAKSVPPQEKKKSSSLVREIDKIDKDR